MTVNYTEFLLASRVKWTQKWPILGISRPPGVSKTLLVGTPEGREISKIAILAILASRG